jgi:dihydroflavonol-4-reductase
VVVVRAVARGHWLAAERGRVGERYILGSENLTLREIFAALGEPPRWRVPYGVAYGAALVSTGWAAVTGRAPRAPLEGVRMARKKMWVSHAKAARELGYAPAAARVGLERAAGWFRANGYCR